MSGRSVAYGDRKLAVAFDVHQVITPHEVSTLDDLGAAVRAAVANPTAAKPLTELVGADTKVAMILDDSTRLFGQGLVAAECIDAMPTLRGENLTVLVAYGNHVTEEEEVLDLPGNLPADAKIWHHEYDRKDMNERIGVVPTARRCEFFRYAVSDGLLALADAPVHFLRIIRALMFGGPFAALSRTGTGAVGVWAKMIVAMQDTVVEIATPAARADLVLAIGQVKPHFFAGYGGGAKSVVPGVASVKTIARDHFMMRHESARLGNVDGNICRDNLEACVALGPPVFSVNVVVDAQKRPVAVTAGHMIDAHRAAVRGAREMTRVPGRRTGIVIAGAAFPEALDLYQLTKIIVPAAAFAARGGAVIVAGPCPRGIGWGRVINEIIYELLLRRILPRGVKVIMLTDIPKRTMAATPFTPASSLDEAMAMARRHAGARAEVTLIEGAGLIEPAPDP